MRCVDYIASFSSQVYCKLNKVYKGTNALKTVPAAKLSLKIAPEKGQPEVGIDCVQSQYNTKRVQKE